MALEYNVVIDPLYGAFLRSREVIRAQVVEAARYCAPRGLPLIRVVDFRLVNERAGLDRYSLTTEQQIMDELLPMLSEEASSLLFITVVVPKGTIGPCPHSFYVCGVELLDPLSSAMRRAGFLVGEYRAVELVFSCVAMRRDFVGRYFEREDYYRWFLYFVELHSAGWYSDVVEATRVRDYDDLNVLFESGLYYFLLAN